MKRVFRIRGEGKVKDIGLRGLGAYPQVEHPDAKVALIQALIPLGLQAVGDLLAEEVTRLAGPRYARTGGQPGLVRWSQQPGSVYLADQKVPLPVPRVRDLARNTEVPLTTYQQFRAPRHGDLGLFRKVLLGLSCRDYATCAEAVPAAFGLSPSTVSRRFIRASARRLRAFLARRVDGYDLVALVLDGKTFAADEMVMALGVTLTGEKVLLGFVQTGTENEKVCAAFLRDLVERGLRYEQGRLCVLDGSKGFRKAVASAFGPQAAVQRSQWHKRENVVAYLPKGQQATWRRKLQAAYERPSYPEAKAALLRCRQELRLMNESAVASLDEGFEETLTLHRLGVFGALGTSLKTTNCLESINALVERRTWKVTSWRSSDQKHRWLAAALLDIEPRLRRTRGYRSLPQLRHALQSEIRGQEDRAEHRAA
jgi:transposase-like protein